MCNYAELGQFVLWESLRLESQESSKLPTLNLARFVSFLAGEQTIATSSAKNYSHPYPPDRFELRIETSEWVSAKLASGFRK